ncbi:OYElike2FMN [Aspergillus parasiticus SU-1]|uniref:OYElike2FMN n=1 Tax=Aspergillus parasiticus (strain ATCC 56775 / NRRL 5862 / SRRC 143 / SU-1) TaxID=1403190 RepID=A0A0F0IFX6_ASPPU|nr:OYElike2FMN [Aspergillus parasiticus SU-1]
MTSVINEPIKLPCGLVLQNRLVKVKAKYKTRVPDQKFTRAYGEWGKGRWGALLTGNIQVDPRNLGNYYDLATRESAPREDQLNAWKQYAAACQEQGTPAIAQICHPGRQSPRGAGERGIFGTPIAPSPVPLKIGEGCAATILRNIAFGVPKEMTVSDIKQVVQQFVNSARFLAECGFAGVELHAAHGYLLSQFLSPKSNIRHDKYGGSPEARARIVLEIIKETRAVVPENFCIGLKLNSADHSASDFEDTMKQIGLFAESGIDFLEVSGGTYEDPTMMGRGLKEEIASETVQRTAAREAFFFDFAKETRRRFPGLILMLTGGFRSRQGIQAALKGGACDIVGIGRPAVVCPNFPELIMDDKYTDDEAKVILGKVPTPLWARIFQIRVLGGGAETQFYAGQIKRMATGYATHAP